MTESAQSTAMNIDVVDEWAAKLSGIVFPIFEKTAQLMNGIDESSGFSMDRVCHDVLFDAGAVLALLRKANSMTRGPLASDVTTAENAAMMIGLHNLKELPKKLPRIQLPANDSMQQGFLQIVSRAYHAGYQSYEFAARRADMTPKEVFIAAFMHDIGKMALWLNGGDEMRQIQKLVYEEYMPLDEAQYVVLGFSTDELSLALARRWNLPELVQDALQAEKATNKRVLGVMLAVQLARYAEHSWYSQQACECIENIAEYLEMSYESAVSFVHKNAINAARETEHLGTWHAAANLPMIYIPAVEEQTEDGVVAIDKQSNEAAPVHFCLVPQHDVYQEVENKIRKFSNISNVYELLELGMHGYHEGLGLNRVVFAMLSKERDQLQARHLAGTDNDPMFSQFAIQLEPANLFTHIMKKQQSVWINDENRERFFPLVPTDVRRLIKTESFMASSIFAKEKPIGLIYADRHLGDSHLDSHTYERFKRLSRLIAAAIEYLSRS